MGSNPIDTITCFEDWFEPDRLKGDMGNLQCRNETETARPEAEIQNNVLGQANS
jgi:hypothetical protein